MSRKRMDVELWDSVSDEYNAWLDADDEERQRLRAELAAENPGLVEILDELTAASADGFLETPALMLAAQEIAADEAALIGNGMTIGPYRIVSLLARGGMGDVYRATDERLQRDVALKVLTDMRTGEARRVDRFMQEARLTASLDHPNVVRVFDVGRFEDRTYLVAELLEGETLRARISRGAIPYEEVIRIGTEIANGLAAAHAAGLVHRDLKPDNVFLTRSGVTKILDFGIAKLVQDETVRGGFSTATGVLLGTAGYIAPEQIRGLPVDGRADLFALGTVLFEMLTAERAFARDHLIESLHAILHDPPSNALVQRSDIPRGLTSVVSRLLEKAPEERFQSAGEVVDVLAHVDPADATPPPRARHLSRAALGAGTIAIVLAIIAGSLLYIRSRSDTEGAAADTAATQVVQQPIRLAIMPVRSIPPSDAHDPLELGLAEVLISRLGQVSDLRVLPLSATRQLGGEEPAAVARKLGAHRVLTVTLQRDRDRVRAIPRLVSSADELLWGTTVDTDASSVFSVQDIIVGRVVDELAPRLSTGTRERLTRAGTSSNEAWEAYILARSHVLNATGADQRMAMNAFEKALELDPNYADAWAGLGTAYKRMPFNGGMSTAEAYTKAKSAAVRALAIEPDHAEAHSLLGIAAFWLERDYEEGVRLLRRAVELQPSSADSQLWLALAYASLGRHDEALVEVRRARALDPSWPLARGQEGHILVLGRRYEEALRHLDDAIKIDPRFWPARAWKIMALVGLERYEDVINETEAVSALARSTGSQLPAVVFNGFKGFALARAGRRVEAEALLEEISRNGVRDQHVSIALILHGLGRDQEAFDNIRIAIAEDDQATVMLGVQPWWDGVRDAPEFREILREADLLEVSDRASGHSRQDS